MSTAVSKLYSDYDGSFTLGGGMTPAATTFVWEGVHWTANILFMRFALILLAVALTLFGAIFFDRFDPSRSKPKRMNAKRNASNSAEPVPALRTSPPTVSLTALSAQIASVSSTSYSRNLKIPGRRERWWWYAGAAGFIIASIASPTEVVHQFILPLAWAWHIFSLPHRQP